MLFVIIIVLIVIIHVIVDTDNINKYSNDDYQLSS